MNTVQLRNSLRENRLKKNITQEQLAAMVGVTRQTVIAVEKGKFVPSVKLALQLARALDTPVGEMFRLADNDGEET